MKKNIIRIVLLMLVIVIGIVTYAYFWYQNGIKVSNNGTDKPQLFTITNGQSVESIGNKLFDEKLISDKTIFTIYMKLNPDKGNAIKAGKFYIAGNKSLIEVIDTLINSPKVTEIKITIPEGLRYDEVVKIIVKAYEGVENITEAELTRIVENPDQYEFSSSVQKFLDKYKPEGANLEGFLYPSTYQFALETTPKEIIEKLVSTLSKKLTAEDLEALEESDYSLYEVLTIASMLERETITKEEQPMVADIIYKRLEKGINGVKLLQIDATLAYPEKDWKIPFSKVKEKDTPYNTYKYPGLPPTPISNPGIITIEATLFPDSNSYYYYLHDNDGIIHYAKTLAEHNANVNKYLR